jgi:putative addiction module component (TIGR02574 family)
MEHAMSEAVAKLLPLLDALTDAEREEVHDYLQKHDAAFVAELNRRVAELESGAVKAIPHEEVMRRMKEKYG